MPIGAITGAIGAGTSLIGGLLGKSAADKAAAAQAAAAEKAAAFSKAQGQQAADYQTRIAGQQTGNEQPFIGAGQGAVNSLAGMLGPGGELTQKFGPFEAPTGVTEQNDPGYQFRLQQGSNMLQNSAAARGGLLSTGTAKNLTDYGQNAASAEYGNVYNRALQTYGTNFNTFNTNANNLYNRLYGVAGLGASSAGNLNNVLQSGAGNMSSTLLGTSQQVGNAYQNAGAARASGYVGGANALSNMFGGIGNAISGGILLGRGGNSNMLPGGASDQAWLQGGS